MNSCKLYILLFCVFVALRLQAQDDNAQSIDTIASVDTIDTIASIDTIATIATINSQLSIFKLQGDTQNIASLQKDSVKLAKQLRKEQRALERAQHGKWQETVSF